MSTLHSKYLEEDFRTIEACKKYLLPKQFGDYRGKKILEIEQICVGTSSMNYEEYLNCRNYSFIVKLLGHSVLKPVKKLTEFLFNIFNKL